MDLLDFIWCYSFKFVQWFNSEKLQIQIVYKWPAAFSPKDGIFCSTCLLLVPTPLSFICCVDDDVGSLPVDVYMFFFNYAIFNIHKIIFIMCVGYRVNYLWITILSIHCIYRELFPSPFDCLYLPYSPSNSHRKFRKLHNLSIFKYCIKYWICMYLLKPCHLSMVHRPVALVSSGSLLEVQNLSPAPDLPIQNFNKTPCRFMCALV